MSFAQQTNVSDKTSNAHAISTPIRLFLPSIKLCDNASTANNDAVLTAIFFVVVVVIILHQDKTK